jgi:hypothetical protein
MSVNGMVRPCSCPARKRSYSVNAAADCMGLPSLVVFACLARPLTRCVVKLMSPRKIAVPEEHR